MIKLSYIIWKIDEKMEILLQVPVQLTNGAYNQIVASSIMNDDELTIFCIPSSMASEEEDLVKHSSLSL